MISTAFSVKRVIDKPMVELEVIHEIWWEDIGNAFHILSGRSIEGGDESLKTLRTLEGKYVKIFGYMLPIRQSDKHSHFLLSTRPHSCPFCMPENAGSMIEVLLTKKASYTQEVLDIVGKLELSDGKEGSIFFTLREAYIVNKK
jgi:hypothetical protein